MGPLPEGVSHIMRVSLLAPKFRYLDLTRKSILFLLPPSGGVSHWSHCHYGYFDSLCHPASCKVTSRRQCYPRTCFPHQRHNECWGCPSPRQASSTATGRTAPYQSILSIHQGQQQGGLWLEWSSSSGEGRVQLHRGEPVL